MSRYTYEGRVKITAIPYDPATPLDMSALTAADIASGVDFTAYLPTAGVGISHNQNMASLPMIDKRQVASQPGSETAEANLTFVFDDEFDTDNPYDYFNHGDDVYLVRSLAGWSAGDGDTPAEGDRYAAYLATSGEPQPNTPAQDEFSQFVVPFGLQEWDVHGVVAAAGA